MPQKCSVTTSSVPGKSTHLPSPRTGQTGPRRRIIVAGLGSELPDRRLSPGTRSQSSWGCRLNLWLGTGSLGQRVACTLNESQLTSRSDKQLQLSRLLVPLLAVVAISSKGNGGCMKRTVTLVILAAVLLSPASGMAASQGGGEEISLSWTSQLQAVERWLAALFMEEATTQRDAAPASAVGGEKGEPLPNAGTTWDANG